MELTVFWSEYASYKLKEIYEYYKSNADKKVATKIVESIVDETNRLKIRPKIGQAEDFLSESPKGFRYLIYKNHKIIYWIDESKNRVDISNVFDTRQNPIKLKSTK